jgi:uncharacterized membrane protein
MKNNAFKPLGVDHLEEIFDKDLTLGEKISDWVADFVGSWTFIICFAVFLILWMGINAIALFFHIPWLGFDSPPFILLNLMCSFMAAFQFPLVLMSQNRGSQKDRERDKLQFEITTTIRTELYAINEKLNALLTERQEIIKEIQDAVEEIKEEHNTFIEGYADDEED